MAWVARTCAKALPFLFLAGIIGGVSTAARAYVSGGHSYELTCNEEGYIMTSTYPVARFVEAGAQSTVWNQREKIYLGKSCDALHDLFGKGKWCASNGGISVEFEDMTFGFPRQELYCEGFESKGYICEC